MRLNDTVESQRSPLRASSAPGPMAPLRAGFLATCASTVQSNLRGDA
jgi:hypothetical protein